MVATGTITRRPEPSTRLSTPPSVRAVVTRASTSSGDCSDSSTISRATFCTPILTSTGKPFVRVVRQRPRHFAPIVVLLRRLTRVGARSFPLDLGEAAQTTPGQRAHQPGRFVSGDRRALGQPEAVSYTHLRAHETRHDLVCRLLLEKKK